MNDIDQMNQMMMHVQMQNQMIQQNDLRQRSMLDMQEQDRIMREQAARRKKRKKRR